VIVPTPSRSLGVNYSIKWAAVFIATRLIAFTSPTPDRAMRSSARIKTERDSSFDVHAEATGGQTTIAQDISRTRFRRASDPHDMSDRRCSRDVRRYGDCSANVECVAPTTANPSPGCRTRHQNQLTFETLPLHVAHGRSTLCPRAIVRKPTLAGKRSRSSGSKERSTVKNKF